MRIRTTFGVLAFPLFLVAVVISSSACGTLRNINSDQPLPLGGLIDDADSIYSTAKKAKPDLDTAVLAPLFVAGFTLEVGLSAVGDVVTLPWVIWMNAKAGWSQLHSPKNMPSPGEAVPMVPATFSAWEKAPALTDEKAPPVPTLETDPRYIPWLNSPSR
jgi:hypothetical protein